MRRKGFNFIFQMKDGIKLNIVDYHNPAVKLFKRYMEEEYGGDTDGKHKKANKRDDHKGHRGKVRKRPV